MFFGEYPPITIQMQNNNLDSRQDSPLFPRKHHNTEEDDTMGNQEEVEQALQECASMMEDDAEEEFQQSGDSLNSSAKRTEHSASSVQCNEGLHHPEVSSFLRDQAGFIVSPRKRSVLFSSSYPLSNRDASTTALHTSGENVLSSSSPLDAVQAALSVVQQEEPVYLAPRFSQPQEEESPERHQHGSVALNVNRQFLFASQSFGNASETTSNIHSWTNRGTFLEPGSPTSTTARDFLREVPCPSIPIQSVGSNCSTDGSSVLQSVRSFSMDLSDSTSLVRVRNAASQMFLQRASADDRSVTSRKPSSNGRSLTRSFAWSHDSQEDLRITKRARMGSSNFGLTIHIPDRQLSGNLFIPPGAAATSPQMSQQDNETTIRESSSHFLEEVQEHRDDPTFSPTMVHWEEKLIDGEELLARAARHHERKEQEQKGLSYSDFASSCSLRSDHGTALPPPIAPAESATQYSFDSGP